MNSTFSVRSRRRNGQSRIFTAQTDRQAMDAAMAWMQAEQDVIAAASNLLRQLSDIREMLEETDDTGSTTAAFSSLEQSIKLATKT